jgi:hypothetical protein
MSTTLPENASWLVNAGIDDMQSRLASMTGTPQDLADLRAAIIHEKAQPAPRVSRLKPMETKLRKLSDSITAASEKILLTKNGAPTHAITPPPLAAAAEALTRLECERLDHERKHQLALIPIQCKQGLHCLKAHAEFAHNPGKGGRPKKPSRREGLSKPHSFGEWLTNSAPFLKEPTAYKYMSAVRGLGLDENATEEQVETAVAAKIAAFERISLKALIDSAVDPAKPVDPAPKNLEQAEFDFLRQSLSHFREESETLCRLKPQLDAYPDFKRAATARIYSMLYELTGTHWQPSDEPDALAAINPDTIDL